MKNVAFWSSTPQQGKTTAAKFLVDNHDYIRIAFADPIKFMIERLLHSAGYSPLEVRYFLNEGKEREIDLIGTSYRHLARTLGTEWGRKLIHPDVWLKIAESKIQHSRPPICVDDLRFPNEAEMLKAKGFTLVKIVRPSLRPGEDSHQSDVALRDFDSWDHVIKNDGSLEQLCARVESVVK